MVTDATKKLREPVAYILLAFAGLVALALLIRLFVGSAGFTNAAAVVQGQVTPPTLQALVLLVSLAASVWLVNEAGERTPNARTVTLAALSITGLLVLIGLIVAFASFGETSTAGLKITSFIFAIGGLALYGVAGIYILKTFQSLPAPVRAAKPASQGQFAGQQGQYGAPGQYPQQGGQYGTQQGQYGQYGAPQGQYGQNEQYGAYGAGAAGAAGAAAGAAGGYAAAQGGEQQWPQEQSWNQGEQQQTWPVSDAEAQPHAETPAAQPAEQAWSAEGQAAEPTQQWSPEGQQQWGGQEQGQQWPQEQQQWGGADSGQQWGAPAQEQYGQPAQQEWPAQEAAQPEQQHQSWPQEGQAWQAEAAPAAEQPAEAAVPEGADETRVETPVSDAPKDEEGQQQQGQGGQQGWWSQPS